MISIAIPCMLKRILAFFNSSPRNYYDCSCSVPYKLQVYCIEKTLKILKKNIGCQIEYFFKADYIVHKSLTTGLEKELNIDEITNIVIENDMFFSSLVIKRIWHVLYLLI